MSNRLFLALAATALAATAIAAIDRGGITRGRVISTAPFVVGSTEFDVSQATVDAHGVPATVDDLQVGQVVTVTSTFNGMALASHVAYDPLVRGTIDAVGRGEFMLLGQTVHYDSATRFGPRSRGLAGLQLLRLLSLAQADSNLLVPGQRVEVSGYLLGDESIQATRIDLAPPGDDAVTGQVTEIDNDRLSINLLVVDISDAEIPDPAEQPQPGDRLTVLGRLVQPGLLAARALLPVLPFASVEPGEELDLEGYVTRFVSPEDFDVDGVPVRTTSETEYDGGTVADLGIDVRVELEGVVDAAGAVIVAEEIEFEEDEDEDQDEDEDDGEAPDADD